jgi:hypothetical protein
MTPRAAVAENLDQFEARPSQSRFERRKVSEVVPAFMKALEKVTAEWYIEARASRASLVFWRTRRSALLFL